MRRFCLLLALLLSLPLAAGDAAARPLETARKGQKDRSCHPAALATLKRLSPRGYDIYARLDDKEQFVTWIECKDMELELATAVHEAVHALTEQLDGYPLIAGGSVPRLQRLSKLARPGLVAPHFDKSDTYVQTYLLPGAASSADDLIYLLDELNAYTHDLYTASRIRALSAGPGARIGRRDGLTALMSFFKRYAEEARQRDTAAWAELKRPETRKLLLTLWVQAEGVLAEACLKPGSGLDDSHSIKALCAPDSGGALQGLLGRPPVCPRRCEVSMKAPVGQE